MDTTITDERIREIAKEIKAIFEIASIEAAYDATELEEENKNKVNAMLVSFAVNDSTS